MELGSIWTTARLTVSIRVANSMSRTRSWSARPSAGRSRSRSPPAAGLCIGQAVVQGRELFRREIMRGWPGPAES